MPEPKIAQKEPYKVALEAEKKYSWCTCGESSTQPFCDGTHKVAMEFKSLPIFVNESKDYFLCGCKKTSTPPFCDGTHKSC